MPFFQNPLDSEFVSYIAGSDKKYSIEFRVKQNRNTSVEMMSGSAGPWNLTGKATLTINYSVDSGRSFHPIAVDVTTAAASAAAVTAAEAAAALNASTGFAALYVASAQVDNRGQGWLRIRANTPRHQFKSYVSNGSAEGVLRFNRYAGVVELPTYFDRHTIANAGLYEGGLGMLVKLNTASSTDQAVITGAGLDYTTTQTDWQLLKGRDGQFMFKKYTVDGSDRVTALVEYSAGAKAGDFARKTTYTYTGANKTPDQSTQIPYTLTSGDMLTPS